MWNDVEVAAGDQRLIDRHGTDELSIMWQSLECNLRIWILRAANEWMDEKTNISSDEPIDHRPPTERKTYHSRDANDVACAAAFAISNLYLLHLHETYRCRTFTDIEKIVQPSTGVIHQMCYTFGHAHTHFCVLITRRDNKMRHAHIKQNEIKSISSASHPWILERLVYCDGLNAQPGSIEWHNIYLRLISKSENWAGWLWADSALTQMS